MAPKTFRGVHGSGRPHTSPKCLRRRAIHPNRHLQGTHRRDRPTDLATSMTIAACLDHAMVRHCRSRGKRRDIEDNSLPLPRTVDVKGPPDQPRPIQ